MTTSNILTVLGIVATVIFGVWGLVVVLRRRYPGEISFVRDPYLGLFESIVKNLPELSVQYAGKPVSQGLVLIKGALLNSGSKDITEQMIEKRLEFHLPDNYRWVTAKIVGSSPNVIASVSISGQVMSFSTGLFRCSEYIRFQAIVEVPLAEQGEKKPTESVEEQLDKVLTIRHRIADTKSVAVVDLPSSRLGKRRVGKTLAMSIGITLLILAASLKYLFTGIPADVHFTIMGTNSVPIEVSLKPRLDGTVRLKGVNEKYANKMPIAEFFHNYNPEAKIVASSELKAIAIFMLLYISFPWVLCAVAYRERRKAERMRALLELEDG